MEKKSYSVVFWMGIAALFLTACTINPDRTLERFVEHWFKGELEKVEPYLMPESRKYVNLLKNVKSPEEFEKMNETEVKFKVMNLVKKNDSIRVYHCEVTLDEKKQEMNITLKRVKHKWFVEITN